jgi:voltage-gated sodium channel
MADLCRRVAASPSFQNAILGVILANAVLIGLETSAGVMARHGDLLHAANLVVQAVFVLEILIRLAAYWPGVARFFADGWNVFDFVVVAVSLLPAAGPVATVVRLVRVLRVARLVSALPDLRLIIGTMLRSIPSMGHVIVLLSLVLYIYAVLGYHLFGATQSAHFGNLGRAFLTLFQMLTLEGWAEVQATSLEYHRFAWIYYASFIIVAVFVVVNLFIAVVLNNLEKAREEEQASADRSSSHAELIARIEVLKIGLERLERDLRAP